jgi:NADH:ubiquinone oxidoreductase subunit E
MPGRGAFSPTRQDRLYLSYVDAEFMRSNSQIRLVVCVNERLGLGVKSCAGSGSRQLIELIRQQLAERNLDYVVDEQVCLGHCEQDIALRIAPGGPFFLQVVRQDIPHIIEQLERFTPAG